MTNTSESHTKRRAKTIVAIAGLILTILGYLFDHAERYPWMVNVFAPAYSRATGAYEDMMTAVDFASKGTPKVLRPGDSGFIELANVLLPDFPEIKDASIIEQIRIKELGLVAGAYFPEKKTNYSGVQPRFEITLKGGTILAKYTFDMRLAIRQMFLEDSIFFWGSIVFWGGVLITILSLFL
jgi:hypothetical protein